MRPVIILFAKAPISGNVKTRLQPAVTAEEAALLHTAFVWDVIEQLQRLKGVDVELHTDRDTRVWDASGLVRRLQVDGPLQLKLLHALRNGLRSHEAAFLLGSDAPTLPLSHVESMLRSGADVTLGPTADGGFWGILCRRIDDGMFDGVDWSSGDECRQTATSCHRAGMSVALGPEWWDVDHPHDLRRLAETPELPRHTIKVFNRVTTLAGLRHTE